MARLWVPRRDEPVPSELAPLPPGGPLGELLARLLWQRGITSTVEAEAFLEPTLSHGLRPPSAIPALAAASERIATAARVRVEAAQSVHAVVASTALRAGLGSEATGSTVTIVVGSDEVTVDGTAIDGGPLDLDVAGLVFYLLIALRRVVRERGLDTPDPRAQLDLLALSTLAAGSVLRAERRVVVSLGLRRMADRLRPGLSAIAESALVARPTARAICTRIVPRLAAAVALGNADCVRSLLQASSIDEAAAAAASIEIDAARRRTDSVISETMVTDAIAVDGDWSLAEANARLMLALGRLEPHGPGNPEPVLVARGARLDGARLAGDPTRPYWRLRLRQDSHTVRGVAQQLPASEIVVGRLYDVAYTPRAGQVRGGGPIEIAVHDLREHIPLAVGQANETTA